MPMLGTASSGIERRAPMATALATSSTPMGPLQSEMLGLRSLSAL